jgi:hypothetical protein
MPPSEASAPGRVPAQRVREEEAVRLERGVQLLTRHPGLDGRVEVGRFDAKDAVHAREVEADAAAHRRAVALERRAGAVGDERGAVPSADPDDRADLVGRRGVGDRLRRVGRAEAGVGAVP